jgi:hypothetical protein
MERMLSRILLGAALSIGVVAHAADSSAPEGAPDLTARWLASCDADEPHEFFSVRVFAGGDIRYVGGNHAREVGARATQIKPHEARYLVSRAVDFIRAPPPRLRSRPRSGPPVACMEFATQADGRLQVRREPIDTRASKVFSNDIVRKTPLLQWVCPDRPAVGESGLSLAPFCRQWPRGAPRSI